MPPVPEVVPASLRRSDRPDRFLSAYQFVIRGYAALAGHTRALTPDPVNRDLALVVAGRRAEGAAVVSLRLEAPDGGVLPRWHPGAHVDVVLPSGRLRQYSLCGDPRDRRGYRIAVRRISDGGGGSVEIHDGLAVGTPLTVRGPRNAFPFAYPHLARAGISHVAFVAAGIGITAILPMVRAAAAAGVDWHLTYLGRSRSTMAFLDELGRLDPTRVTVHDGPPLPVTDLLAHVGPHTSLYFCGPPALLERLGAALDGRACAGFHFERFSPPPVVGGSAFEVRLRRAGQTVHVAPDTSALAAVRDVLPVAYSCQQGFCGTCRVRVCSGDVERRGRSRFLDEPDTMLLCTDRALGGHLEVDL